MLVALTLFPQMVTTTIASIFTGFQNYEYNAYVDLVISPLRLVGIFVMMAMGYGVEEIMLMLVGLFFLGLLLQIYFLNRLMPLGSLVSGVKLDSGVRKDAIKYAMTLMGTQGLNYFIWSQAEVLFLGLYCTIEDIAYYNLAFKIPRMVITLIPYVFGRVLLPTVAEQFGKGDMDKIKTIYITSARYLMMLTFPIVVGGIVLAAPLINVLYGLEYQPSIALMQIIFIPFSTIGLTHASTSIIYGINKPSFILKTGIPLVIISIGLYLWAVPRYGVMGAAVAGSIPRISVFFIYNYYVYRKIGVHWPFGDTIRVIAASGIMGAAVFGIRSFTNDTLSLVIGIIFGAIIFLITLIALRFVTQQEIGLLRKFQKRIPSAFKGKYSTMVNLVETFARKSPS